MKRIIVILALCFITVISFRGQSLAYTIENPTYLPYDAVAVNNLDTWYGTYDVTWEWGTFAEVFPSGMPQFTINYDVEDGIMRYLVSALNENDIMHVYDPDEGGMAIGTPDFYMPQYPPYNGSIWTYYAYNPNSGENSSFSYLAHQVSDDSHMWAVFSPSATTAPVPEPATLLLLGTGLIGLAGVGRKRLFSKRS
jgi:hypothetical protein